MAFQMNSEELQTALRDLMKNKEVTEAAMQPIAEIMKVKYDAFVKAGFTPEQALRIIEARGLNV